MRLTCRPPERTKATKLNDFSHSRITAIPLSMTSTVPPPSSLTATPVTLPPQPPQFFSAPPVVSRDPKPCRTSPPPSSRPTQNDILKRIVKADDGIKKKSQQQSQQPHHFKGMKGTIVPPPPLSKYKRPHPIVPHQPGERYPLGMPYGSRKFLLLTCILGDDVLARIVRKIVRPPFLDIAFQNTFKRVRGGVVFLKSFEWNGVILVT